MKVVGALSFIWDSNSIVHETKINLYLMIPVNLTLWNGETWLGNKTDLALLDAFHHKTIRRILHISMANVTKLRLKNKIIRSKFGNIKKLSDLWRSHLLKYVSWSTHQNEISIPKQILSAHVSGKRICGQPFWTIKDTTIESIRLMIPSTLHNGNYSY